MNILITGGCGFLGSNLAEKILVEKKHELTLLDNLYRFGSEENLQWLKSKGDFNFIMGDVRNRETIEEVFAKKLPDVVFHLAGQVAMTTSINDPRSDFEINVLGTINILESVRKYVPKAIIIYSSTNKVYGDLENVTYYETDTRYQAIGYENGFDENTQLSFHSPYGCSKGAADQYMLDYHRIFGLKTIVFRHSSMFGGRQFSTYDQGWIGWFCQKAVETKLGTLDQPFTISGNGKQVRDVLHAHDMVSLYFTAVDHAETLKGNAFNIGGGMGNSLSLIELFLILEASLNIKLNYTKLPFRESDQKVFVADLSKINLMTGWIPKVTKENGIKLMIEWLFSKQLN